MAPKLEKDIEQVALKLAEAVETDPERLGGESVFRETRVPVRSLFDHLSAGDSVETFLDDFPGVTRDQVQAILEVAVRCLLEEIQGR